MLIEFTAQEQTHVRAIMDDIITHEELKPNKQFRKSAMWYKNKFTGTNNGINLKIRHVAELYTLVASSLDVLNRTRKAENLPEEQKPEVVNYIVIVAQLMEKLKHVALSSGRYAENA